MALANLSSAAGRGSGRGGLALACSAGDNVGVNGDRGTLGKGGDDAAPFSGCVGGFDVSVEVWGPAS